MGRLAGEQLTADYLNHIVSLFHQHMCTVSPHTVQEPLYYWTGAKAEKFLRVGPWDAKPDILLAPVHNGLKCPITSVYGHTSVVRLGTSHCGLRPRIFVIYLATHVTKQGTTESSCPGVSAWFDHSSFHILAALKLGQFHHLLNVDILPFLQPQSQPLRPYLQAMWTALYPPSSLSFGSYETIDMCSLGTDKGWTPPNAPLSAEPQECCDEFIMILICAISQLSQSEHYESTGQKASNPFKRTEYY
ncbi:hypothetical protein C0991_010818 [Blastosporella zonata]|nr:hypothetical protein C0991_010818 [Blastosporella zonata]